MNENLLLERAIQAALECEAHGFKHTAECFQAIAMTSRLPLEETRLGERVFTPVDLLK